MKPSARRRWLAATALAAVVTCVLAATGLFAPCHEGEAPMSCCPDSSQAPTAGAQVALLATAVLGASFEMPQPVFSSALAPAPQVSLLGHQRGLYLRLSTLLI